VAATQPVSGNSNKIGTLLSAATEDGGVITGNASGYQVGIEAEVTETKWQS